MKFIFFTDSHIKGVNPGRRKDIYYVAVLKKLMEIGYVVKQEDIDFVVHGGDLFDLPKVSNKLFGQVASIIKDWGREMYVVPGNHDVYGQNIETLEHTSLGALAKAKVVNLMTRDNSPFYFQKKSEPNCPLIAFTGQEYYSGIDKGINNDYEIEPSQAKFNFLVAHGMLLDKPFHPDVPHTVMSNVITSADMVLSGHYHPGPIEVVVNNTRFLNPGSMARVEISKRMPTYAIVEVTDNGINYELRQFNCAEPSEDVFDFTSATEEKQHKGTLETFKKTIQDIDVKDANNINDILNKVTANLNSSVKHTNAVISMITEAQKKETNTNLNGFLPDPDSIQLVKVILHNFQSHDHTEIDLDVDSLIALLGESDQGKSAVLRAIKWVLYNEPKGTDFIRQGESTCYATLIFSNGNKLTRQKTNSSSGFYETYDAKTGATQKYTGFSHTIPMEVFNIHQMPKVHIGKEQVSFNIAEQLDGPFMLSQSASDRASIIGKITGVQVVDNAIQNVSKDISNIQKDIKSVERDLQDNDKELSQFSDIEQMKNDISMGELILDGIDATNNSINNYETLQNDIDSFNINLATESYNYKKFSNLDGIEKLIQLMEEEDKYNLSLSAINTTSLNNANEKRVVMSKLDSLPDMDDLNSLIGNIDSERAIHDDLRSLKADLTIVAHDITNISSYISGLCKCDDDIISELDKSYEELKAFNSLNLDYKLSEDNIKNIKQTISSYEEALNNTLIQYREQLKNMGGTCPTCGNHIEEDMIDTLEL